MSDHFAVGDTVSYRDVLGRASSVCHIVRVMPAEQDGRRYRIRNLSELFERSVLGEALTRLAPTPAEDVFKSVGGES